MRTRLGEVAYWTGCGIASGIVVIAFGSVGIYGAVPLGAGLALAGCVWALGLATQRLLTSL